MKDLIERLEKATGPDRELDARIWCRVNGFAFHSMMSRRDNNELLYDHANGDGDRAYGLEWPAYTASFDAAMTLVPKNYTPHLCLPPHATCEVQLWCHVSDDCSTIRETQDKDVKSESRTGPLALCIAALKARATTPTRIKDNE